jgi:hypothetical protein
MSLFSDVFSLPVHFEFFAIFSNCLHFAKFVCLLKRLQRLKQEWQKSPGGTRQTYSKNQVWFGEIERKSAKLSKTTFTYRSSVFSTTTLQGVKRKKANESHPESEFVNI